MCIPTKNAAGAAVLLLTALLTSGASGEYRSESGRLYDRLRLTRFAGTATIGN